MRDDLVYIVTAPSGTGKTTLNRRLAHDFPDIRLSVSLTTRAMRPGEVNGDHYHFVSRAEFQQRVAEGGMLEWADVFGEFYGTSAAEVERITSAQQRALLEIDVQGWAQAKPKLSRAKSIFIAPPSMQTLWKRLKNRGTDDGAKLRRRIQTARSELEAAYNYRYILINGDLESCYKELVSIFEGKPRLALSREEGLDFCAGLIAECDSPAWFEMLERESGSGA